MHPRVGSATLSQLGLHGEGDPNFPWEKPRWDTAVVKSKKVKVFPLATIQRMVRSMPRKLQAFRFDHTYWGSGLVENKQRPRTRRIHSTQKEKRILLYISQHLKSCLRILSSYRIDASQYKFNRHKFRHRGFLKIKREQRVRNERLWMGDKETNFGKNAFIRLRNKL